MSERMVTAKGFEDMTFAEFKAQRDAAMARTAERLMKMNTIKELQELQTDRLDLNEKVDLSARAKALAAEFGAFGLPVPALVTEGLRTLAVVIKAEARDHLTKELREVEASKNTLMTAEQKREMLASREKELNDRLAALA